MAGFGNIAAPLRDSPPFSLFFKRATVLPPVGAEVGAKACPTGMRRPSLAIIPRVADHDHGAKSGVRSGLCGAGHGGDRRTFQGIFRELSARNAPVDRMYSDLRHPKIGAGDRFRTHVPNPGKAAIAGLPVLSKSLVSRHKIDYFQIGGHRHGVVE